MKALMTFSLMIVFVLLLTIVIAQADCIRCGGGLDVICGGESKFTLISKCGQPDYSEDMGEDTVGASRKGSFTAVKEKTELLIYNCGDGQFIKSIKIRGGKIVSITDGDRGYGPNRCE